MPGVAAFIAAHWRAVGALVIVLALAGYIETLRVERDVAYSAEAKAKAELSVFKAHVEAIGKQAEADKIAKEAADKKRKEDSDAENSAALATLADTIGKLRASASSRRVPDLPACASNPAGADRERAEFQPAYRDLLSAVRAEADRCSERTVKLNTAKAWAGQPDK